MAGGFQRRLGVLLLLPVLGGFFQQLQHPQHTVHGSAQLVAHHGQEVAFRLAGGFRLAMGLLQFGHGSLLLVPGAFQGASQLVDVVLQFAQLPLQAAVASHRIFALAQGPQQTGQVTQRRSDLTCQIVGDPEPQNHGKEGGNHTGQQNFLLPCQQPGTGHPKHHLTNAVGPVITLHRAFQHAFRCHRLTINAGMKFDDLVVAFLAVTPLIQQHLTIPIAEHHVLQIRPLHGQLRLTAQVCVITGQYAVFRRRGNLLGEKTAQLAQVPIGILKALPGQRHQQQPQHEQGRHQPQHLQLLANSRAFARHTVTHHGTSPAFLRASSSAPLSR